MTLFEPQNPVPAAPRGPLVRVRLTIAYDGSAFRGMAKNPGVRTVAGDLEAALERVLRHPAALTVAGRTDAGVHAWGQVVSFDAKPAEGDQPLDLDSLVRALNGLCGPEIAVREAALVDDGFSARFSATGRRYRYLVLNEPAPDPFLASQAWHVPQRLDLTAMQLAADAIIGEHDFSSFCRRPKTSDEDAAPSLVRRVLDAQWRELPTETGQRVLRFEISANAFCHQMVRSIVGTLVDTGLGRRPAGQMLASLKAADRAAAGQVAPPHGLTLWEVTYPD